MTLFTSETLGLVTGSDLYSDMIEPCRPLDFSSLVRRVQLTPFVCNPVFMLEICYKQYSFYRFLKYEEAILISPVCIFYSGWRQRRREPRSGLRTPISLSLSTQTPVRCCWRGTKWVRLLPFIQHCSVELTWVGHHYEENLKVWLFLCDHSFNIVAVSHLLITLLCVFSCYRSESRTGLMWCRQVLALSTLQASLLMNHDGWEWTFSDVDTLERNPNSSTDIILSLQNVTSDLHFNLKLKPCHWWFYVCSWFITHLYESDMCSTLIPVSSKKYPDWEEFKQLQASSGV